MFESSLSTAEQPPELLKRIYAETIQALDEAVAIVDLDGCYIEQNAAHRELIGYADAELAGRTPAVHLGERVYQEVLCALRGAGRFEGDVVSTTRDGRRLELRLKAFPILDGTGQPVCFVGIKSDAARRAREAEQLEEALVRQRRTETALRESEHRYRFLFEKSQSAIYITTIDGRFVDVNPAAVELSGYTREELLRLPVARLYADPRDRERFKEAIRRTGVLRDFEVKLRRKNGDTLECLLSASVHRSLTGEIVGYQGVIQDITERKREERELRHHALHDPLTGLPDRGHFCEKLSRAIDRSHHQPHYRFALLFIDFDHFKQVNDTLGHAMGDLLLVEIARRLESLVRPEDTVGRIGGDEFAVLLYHVHDLLEVHHIADRIRRRLREPYGLEGREVLTSASVGVALSSERYARPEDMLRDADAAMYRAKDRGRERYEIFDSELEAEQLARLRMQDELDDPIGAERIRIRLQPIVHLPSAELLGFEALARWSRPGNDLLPPAEFIPLAEQGRAIEEIDLAVLRSACREAAQWQRAFGVGLPVSVNVSGAHFMRDSFVSTVDRALDETGLNPSLLWVEVPERVLMQGGGVALRHFQQLRERGISLCIDDFGVGSSSLQYLSRLPVQSLKVDRSFTEAIALSSASREIVRAIIELGQRLGLRTIVEGVERREQLERLLELGAPAAQGYLFGKPVDPADVPALLRRGHAPPLADEPASPDPS